MKEKEFVHAYLHFAKQTEEKTGISAIAILAQAALESGWGKSAPGNMFFGVKDDDGLNGNEQLLQTTEFSRRADLRFPVIIKIEPVVKDGKKMFKYTIKDYFKKYSSPEESFTDHANFFLRNKRYTVALEHRSNPRDFLTEVAKAGYATDPNYTQLLLKIIETIEKYV